jgi:DNA-binding protein H-NS
MKDLDLNSMTTDQLWRLHELVTAQLISKIATEKALLEDRLRKLGSMTSDEASSDRRPYPKVLPKYRNPIGQGETWAGRGKQPRWLTAQLKSGKKLDDFLISGRLVK